MQTRSYPSGATTTRVVRNVKARRVQFLAPCAGAGAALAELEAGTQVAYLTGPRPTQGWRAWALELEGAGGWELADHYYENANAPILRYTHPTEGAERRVELQWADSWFMGAGAYTPAEALYAWEILGPALARRFEGAVLWNTPASTGRDLWLRKIDHGKAWPVLPPSLLELVHGEGRTPAGRAELLDPISIGSLEGLYEYDGRLMYPALCGGLAGGIPRWERGEDHVYEPFAQGRYLVRAEVPRDWPHNFGMLGAWNEPERRWRYPSAPGESFTAWVEGSELHLAGKCGWQCTILEALVWPRYAGKGPLDSWANALMATRDDLYPVNRKEADPSSSTAARACHLARAAVRSIALHTIGALYTSSHRVTRFASSPAELPAQFRRTARPEADGTYAYPVDEPVRWREMQHPELAAAVWGKARTRLLAGPGGCGALHARGAVVAFRTDAIYTTRPQSWPDDGRAGRFRLKRGAPGPFPYPSSARELLNLRASLPTPS